MGSSRLHEETEIITHMEPNLYRAAVNGKIDVFMNNEDHLEGLLSPTKNTILHIYIKAKTDQESIKPTKFVEEILHKCPPLLLQANIDGDTPLHTATRYGHTPIVKASRGCWLKKMTRSCIFVNSVGETPRHMAIKGGFFVLEILRKNNIPNITVYGGPDGKSLPHEARMTRAILRKMEKLSKQAYQQGWTLLYYVADQGNLSMVKALLEFDWYAVYMKDKEGKIPIQIVACHNLEMVKEIISWCPDSSELVDIGDISDDTMCDILQNPSLHNVLQGKNEDNGITSLSTPNNHQNIYQPIRINNLKFNEENIPTFGMWIEEQQMQRDDTRSYQPILLQKKDEEEYRKNKSPSNSGVNDAKEATFIVAALITTVTFATGDDTVTKYFNSLERLWQDLDLFNDYGWKSTEDAIHNKKTMEAHRIYKFLARLNVEFDEVRGRIIGRSPLPPINEVFVEVQREESHRNVMLGKNTTNGAVESTTLITSEFVANKAVKYPKKAEEKP
nr:uncharacterized protein LOC125423471 [Ziziphus jujuba var. spinosa]